MTKRWFTLLAALPVAALSAQKFQETPQNLTPQQMEARLHYQTGQVKLRGGLATLELPAEFRYLDPRETDLVIRAWGNPPNNETLGMIVPAGANVFQAESWAVVITYDEDGFVKDDDAATVNYDDLLGKMQRALRGENEERRRRGYPEIELVGWAEPPRYDSAAHKLYWAKDLRFGTEAVHTLNYNIRVLGRRGVLVLNAVASMDQLAAVRRDMTKVIAFVDREGSSFFQEWSALFVLPESSGGRFCFYYPRLQTAAPASEATEMIAKPLEQTCLHGSFIALPVTDPNDSEQVVCYRSYFPAAGSQVY